MTTKPMTAAQAVKVLRACAFMTLDALNVSDEDGGPMDIPRIRAALSALDGVHIYASRFKPGDDYWMVMRRGDEWSGPLWFVTKQGKYDSGWDQSLIPLESDCFPTRAEAEAEASRRNKEASRGE